MKQLLANCGCVVAMLDQHKITQAITGQLLLCCGTVGSVLNQEATVSQLQLCCGIAGLASKHTSNC
jgi:hypothetical protein